jgi:hypothetical protein
MKNILTGVIILIFISLQANGQQPRDTLYLKNARNEVEKPAPATDPVTDTTRSLIMRKIILDTLSIDELRLYEDKATGLRDAGRILTLGGISLWVLTSVVAVFTENSSVYTDENNWNYVQETLKGIGFISALGGTPLWAVGGSRMDKVKLLTLDYNELNLFKEKAVKMRHTGMTLTTCGVGIVAASFIAGVMIGEDPSDDPEVTGGEYDIAMKVIGFGGTVGITTAIVGVPLWLTGGSRMAKAELALHKFNIAPVGSMALGLGITIRF